MNILFLAVSDQSKHPVGRHVDLHCNYDFNNWLDGFSNVPFSFSYFDVYESFVNDGPLATERKILDYVTTNKINLAIVPNMYYEVNISFLSKLRAYGVKSLLVFFDDSSRFEDTSRYYLGHCDYIITHESERALELYKSYGVSAEFFPCLPSVSFYERLLATSANSGSEFHDVSFVGANIADRSTYLSALSEAGCSVSIYGGGWPNGRVNQTAMLQIFRDSKISLNFTKSGANDGSKQLKARAFEIMLAGGFLLTEYDPELVSYFEVGKEMDTFSSPEECIHKIKYYLDNQAHREAIRKRGSEKCLNYLNFENAWSQFLGSIASGKTLHESKTVVSTLPAQAIRSFVRWNVSYYRGRVKNKQFVLAADQVIWSMRDLFFFSRIHTIKVWFIAFSALEMFNPVRGLKSILGKTKLFYSIKNTILKSRQGGAHSP